MGCQGQHYLRIPHLIERHRPQLIDAMVGRRQAAALRQQFLSEQKNADKTGHENTPEENEVVNVSASDVSAIDQEGRKHADEYAQLLKSVHGRPFNLVFCLSSLSADTCRLIAPCAMLGWHLSSSISNYCKKCWCVEKMKAYQSEDLSLFARSDSETERR